INIELDHGIRDARLGVQSAGTWAIADECNHRAKTAHFRAAQLLRHVALTEDERSSVESRLEHLQGLIGALSATGGTCAVAEDKVSQHLPQFPQQQRVSMFGAAGGA